MEDIKEKLHEVIMHKLNKALEDGYSDPLLPALIETYERLEKMLPKKTA